MSSITCVLCGSAMAIVAERVCTPVVETRTRVSGFAGIATDHHCETCGLDLTIAGRPAIVTNM